MCFPLTVPMIIGLASTGVAGAMKFIGDKQAEKARVSTFQNERNRQQAFEGDQTKAFQNSLDQTKAMQDNGSVQAATAARDTAFQGSMVSAAPAAAGGYLPGSSSAPSIVATAGERAGAASDASSASLAHALASLGGTTDALQTLNTGIGRNSESIGQIGSAKRGSLGVLQSEMEAASHKGDFLRGIGDLVGNLGRSVAAGSFGGPGKAAISPELVAAGRGSLLPAFPMPTAPQLSFLR